MHASSRRPRTSAAVLILAAAVFAAGLLASTAAAQPAKAKVEVVKIVVKSDSEHARKGSDGKWHDGFLPADLTVHAGEHVLVHVFNYDDSAHSFHAAGLGVNAVILGGSAQAPKETTFGFIAKAPGVYRWHCEPTTASCAARSRSTDASLPRAS